MRSLARRSSSPLCSCCARRRAGRRGRADHAAGRGPEGHALHRPVGRPGHRDRVVRRRGRRRRRRRRRRRGAARSSSASRGAAIDRTGVGPGFSRLADHLPRREGRDAYRRDLRGHRRVRRHGRRSRRRSSRSLGAAGRPARAAGSRRRAARASWPAPLSIGGRVAAGRALLRRAAAREGQAADATAGRPRAAAFPLQDAAARRGDGRRPGQRRRHRGRGRHRRLRRRRPRLGLRPSARRRRPALAVPPGRLRLHRRQQPGRRRGREDVQARRARPRRRASSAATASPRSPGASACCPKRFPMQVIATRRGHRPPARRPRADRRREPPRPADRHLARSRSSAPRRRTDAATTVLGEIPARQTGEMCATIRLVGEREPAAVLQPLRDARRRARRGARARRRRRRWSRDFVEAVGLHRRVQVRDARAWRRRGRT